MIQWTVVVMIQFQVKETEKNCEYQVRYKDEQMDGRIRELEVHYERLLDEARAKYETLKMEKLEMVIRLWLFYVFVDMFLTLIIPEIIDLPVWILRE